MPDAESKYKVSISMSFCKEGAEGSTDPEDSWELKNVYRKMDYGQLVVTQAIAIPALAEALIGIGVVQAEEIGFPVAEQLEALQQMKQLQAGILDRDQIKSQGQTKKP